MLFTGSATLKAHAAKIGEPSIFGSIEKRNASIENIPMRRVSWPFLLAWRQATRTRLKSLTDRLTHIGLGTALLVILILAVFVRPIDHDESQYVAATVLARHLTLYRDFDYLQTPLQPMLLSPLTAWLPIPPLLLLRLCNACLAWFAVLMLRQVVTQLTESRAWGWFAAYLLVISEPLLFAASTARNDILPLLCLCAGIWILLRLEEARGRASILLAVFLGVVMAGAAAAKISYTVPTIAIVAAELLTRGCDRRWSVLIGYALGASAVAIWCLIIASTGMDRAIFDIMIFPARAPGEWYAGLGQGFWLTAGGRTLAFAKFAMLSPAPVLAAALAMSPTDSRAEYGGKFSRRMRRHCYALLVAGAAAALLPAPVWRQYLLPVFPPLICLGIPALRSVLKCKRWQLALAGFLVAGSSITLGQAAAAVILGAPLVEMEERSRALAVLLHRNEIQGPIASISPEFVTEAGAWPDPRFAPGPFIFRTRNGLGMTSRITGISQSDVVARLRAKPPAAIVTGGDALTAGSAALDARFGAAARASGFRAIAKIDGGLVLWKRRSGSR